MQFLILVLLYCYKRNMVNNYFGAFLTSFLILVSSVTNAQEPVRCHSQEVIESKKAKDYSLLDAEYRLNKQIYDLTKNISSGESIVAAVVTIPVVVHVVWNTAVQNISDAQIRSQITVLNEDFAKLNADASNIPNVWKPIAANTQIQFCLASRKPNGDWTNGIERRQTTYTSYTINNYDSAKFYSAGGLDVWNPHHYLNIWVINFAIGTNPVIGIAQMPYENADSTDGVCIKYNVFGKGTSFTNLQPNYNRGRTATHEIGHWLGLYHIWGNGNDCSSTDSIADTPPQSTEHTNCPTFPELSDSCSPVSPGTMFMNYMDYSYDRCMYMFTQDQATRMNLILTLARDSILNSPGCLPAIGIDERDLDNFISIFPNPASKEFTIKLDLPLVQDLKINLYDLFGQKVFEYLNSSVVNDKIHVETNNLQNGIYLIQFVLDNKTITRKIIVSH